MIPISNINRGKLTLVKIKEKITNEPDGLDIRFHNSSFTFKISLCMSKDNNFI